MMILWLLILNFQAPGTPVPQYLKEDIVLKGFNAKDVSIAELFHQISKKERINIVVDTKLQDKVSIQLHQTTLNELIHYFVQTYGVECSVVGGIVHLSPPPEPEPVPLVNDIIWNAKEEKIAFNLTALSLREFARKITELTGHNLIVAEKKVVGNLQGFQGSLPFEQGITILLNSNDFNVLKDEGIWVISNRNPKKKTQSLPEEVTSKTVVKTENATLEPSSRQQKTGLVPILVHDGLVDLHVNQMMIMDIFTELSKQGEMNLCLYGELDQKISVDVINRSFSEIMDLLLNNTEFTYIIENDMFLVGEKTSTLFLTSELLAFEHMNAEMMQQILPASITEGITVTMVKEHNSLLFTGPKNRVQQVKALAESMDLIIPQVLIEVLVVDFTTTNDRDMGVTITNGENQYFPELDLSLDGFRGEDGGFSIRRLPSNFSMRIKAMEKTGRAKIISKPHIAALNGHEAEIVVGTKQFYLLKSEELVGNENPRVRTTERVESIEANINLKITPWVSSKGEVTTLIEPSFTTFLGSVTGSVPPPISTRKLKSTVRLKDGETIILGGLIENFTTQDLAGVPFLSKIPILGSLFRNTKNSQRRSELVIYLTPHVYYGQEGSVEFIEEEEGLNYQLDVSRQKEGIQGDYPKQKSWWQRRKEKIAKKKAMETKSD